MAAAFDNLELALSGVRDLWRTDIFVFIAAEYKKWIPGLTQADLVVDPELYAKLKQEVHLRGLPPSLDLPAETDANLRRVSGPIER
jgi:hypothetical protein